MGKPKERTWIVESTPFQDHNNSVEDLQWSPKEKTVFASCSVDKTIRIWDIRVNQKRSCLNIKAHVRDINTISWNTLTDRLLVSGSDDCSFKIWDIRKFKKKNPEPVAYF